MSNTQNVTERRTALIARLFPAGVPKLWCPPLTHYDAEGRLDRQRTARHLQCLAPHVKAVLVPGSTGDAWEMDAAEQLNVLALVLDIASGLGIRVLVGALHTDGREAHRTIVDTLDWLKSRTGCGEANDAMDAAGICGFTVCPPKGAGLAQDEIVASLTAVLELSVPTAVYQLPQITENEIAAESVAELAATYPHFFLLKDTSGEDRVALSGRDFSGLYLVRGAEGDYGRWLRAAGGPYAGFLLSTANCFAPQLARMIEHVEGGRVEKARLEIAPVETVVARAFEAAADLPDGNPFTNANKAIDHFLAHGRAGFDLPPPRLYAGSTLPPETIAAVGQTLDDNGLLPEAGYLKP